MEYFHSINITFNIWFVLLPVSLVAMIAVGRRGVFLSDRGTIVSYTNPKAIIVCVAGLFSVINTYAIIAGSRMGIRQWFLNCLGPSDDPLLAVLLAAFTTYIVLPVAVLCVFVTLGEFSFLLKYKQIEELQEELFGEESEDEPRHEAHTEEKDDFDVLIEIIDRNTKDE